MGKWPSASIICVWVMAIWTRHFLYHKRDKYVSACGTRSLLVAAFLLRREEKQLRLCGIGGCMSARGKSDKIGTTCRHCGCWQKRLKCVLRFSCYTRLSPASFGERRASQINCSIRVVHLPNNRTHFSSSLLYLFSLLWLLLVFKCEILSNLKKGLYFLTLFNA